MFRTSVIPGCPPRGFTVLSSVDPVLGGPLSLRRAGQHVPLPDEAIGDFPDSSRLRMVRVPAGTPAGDYSLECGGTSWGGLAVLPDPPVVLRERVKDFWCLTLRLDDLAKRPPGGPVVLAFDPGVHRTFNYRGDPIDLSPLPPGSTLRGNGCRLVNEGTTGVLSALFVNAPAGLTFEDFEVVSPFGALLFHRPDPMPGLVLSRCKFTGGLSPAWGFTEALVIDCEFDRGGAQGAPAGLFWRCRFRDVRQGLAYSTGGPANGTLGMLDCEFHDCGRGPVVNTNAGPVVNCFWHGVRVTGNDSNQNGNELLVVEGAGPFNDNLVSDYRGRGNYGDMLIGPGTSVGNLLHNVRIDGRVWLACRPPGECTGNVLDGFECRGLTYGLRPDLGGGVSAGAVHGNVAKSGWIGPPRGGYWNQLMSGPPPAPLPEVVDVDGTNTVEGTVSIE